MSFRTQKEAIVIVVDCGQSMAQKCHKSDRTVFELSKECIINIIKQKIFAESKNEYLLIQFATNDQQNDNNIKINGNLSSSNFDLLRYVSQINSTHIQSNVMEALNVSIQELLKSIKGQKFSALKLALFTNFGHFNVKDLNEFKLMVDKHFIPNEIQLIVICDFIPNQKSRDLSKCQLLGIEAMELIEEKKIGFCYDLEYANNYFSKFECKKASPFPWYSTLELGKGVNSLNIPIVGYIKITAYKRKTGSEAFVRPAAREDIQVSENNDLVEQKPGANLSLTETPIEKVVTYKPSDEQSVEEIEKEEIISAYCYGSTLVPFDVDDKKSFSYQSTEKGLKIIGFCSIHNICAAHQIGDKTMIVIPDPRPKQNNHKLVFQTLVRAMLDKQQVAIVRYAYRDRSSLQIGYLQPYVEDNDVMMIYIQLPFDEDVRRYRFPSLEAKPQYCPTEPQLQAIDDLIDAMDLMNADVDEEGNTCEALQSDAIYDPFLQYWFQCLYHRQLYNNSNELPLPSEQLKDSIEPPIQIRKSAEKFLRKVRQKFPLDCIKEKARKKRNQINITQEASGSESKRTKISEQNLDSSIAIENIKSEVNELIKSEVPFSQVSNHLEVSIKSFVNDLIDIEEYGEHIIDLLKIYRKQSLLNNDPKGFNELMINHMKTFRGTTFWYLMLSHEIGLIGRTECQMSHVSQEEVESFTNLSDDYIKIESD